MNTETLPMNNQLLVEKVEKALESIKPYLEADGGDVKVLSIDKQNKVMIELLGACGSCPMSSMTFQAGIEEAIKKSVPEVTSVEAVNITSPDDPNAKMPF